MTRDEALKRARKMRLARIARRERYRLQKFAKSMGWTIKQARAAWEISEMIIGLAIIATLVSGKSKTKRVLNKVKREFKLKAAAQ